MKGFRVPPPCVLLATVWLLAVAASTAHATTAGVRDGTLYVDGTSDPDAVTVRLLGRDDTALTIADRYRQVSAGDQCVAGGLGEALCARAAFSKIAVSLGDGNDDLVVQSDVPVDARGGAGDDTMVAFGPLPGASPSSVAFDGEEGGDRLGGGAGADVLRGGPGDDALDGHGGDDVIDAGPGRDSVADLSGRDHVRARDGEADYVDCGPYLDDGEFDAVDSTLGCEAGGPPARRPDCVPEVEPLLAAQLTALRRSRRVRVHVAADRACELSAVLSGSDSRVLARATRRASSGAYLTLALPRAAIMRLRKGCVLRLALTSREPSSTITVRRTFQVAVT